MTWYHVSKRRFLTGTILDGSHTSESSRLNGKDIARCAVYIHDSPIPHQSILCDADFHHWHVYEVMPIGKIRYGKDFKEALANQAEIVRYVGNARGIMNNHRGYQGRLKTIEKRWEDDDERGAIRAELNVLHESYTARRSVTRYNKAYKGVK